MYHENAIIDLIFSGGEARWIRQHIVRRTCSCHKRLVMEMFNCLPCHVSMLPGGNIC